MSKKYMDNATGIRNFLLRISGGISIPPVEPPSRITIPSPSPVSIPPNSAARSRSPVKWLNASIFRNWLRNTGNTRVLTMVVSANRFPRI